MLYSSQDVLLKLNKGINNNLFKHLILAGKIETR